LEKKKIPKNKSGEISRREFLKDAGLVVGGAAIGSTVLLAACGGEETTKTVTEATTKTVTTTAPGGTATVTTTAPGGTATVTTTEQVGEVTKTVTESVSKFVCPICSQEFDTLAELQAHFEAVHAGEVPAALNVIKLSINGEEHELQVKPNWTLEHILHDKLCLIGAKEMCGGLGQCGSCTVIMNGRPILSCLTLAIECDGKKIETVEGIAAANHPLIEAYIKNNCMQCGYCTPGFIVTAKALLDRNPDPNEEEIKQALAGNICRCVTYPQHPIAVLEAAKEIQGGG
jgi:aerobic-type carbon monoxide dehydrogenase small subunit (CoxS/CutS family)